MRIDSGHVRGYFVLTVPYLRASSGQRVKIPITRVFSHALERLIMVGTALWPYTAENAR
jgi:hypothetical protein